MGRKGKRVLEQPTGSSTPAVDFETIRLIPAQKQDTSGTGSSLPFGVSAPPGLDPPESKADSSRPLIGPIACPLGQKCQYCPLPCCRCDSTHVLHRCKQHVNWWVGGWGQPIRGSVDP